MGAMSVGLATVLHRDLIIELPTALDQDNPVAGTTITVRLPTTMILRELWWGDPTSRTSGLMAGQTMLQMRLQLITMLVFKLLLLGLIKLSIKKNSTEI